MTYTCITETSRKASERYYKKSMDDLLIRIKNNHKKLMEDD